MRRAARDIGGLFDEMVVDNFAGGGGASTGIERAIGRAVDLAINHDPAAVMMHQANHPHTRHLCESIWEVDPAEATGGRPVGLAWFSPDCKHFSRAKGAKPVSKRIRGLAWIVIKWAKAVRPRVIILENVREFEEWGPLTEMQRPCQLRKGLTFKRWTAMLRNLGYAVEWRVLNAADYGAPTNRRRLFLVARRDGRPIIWPEKTHGPAGSGRKPYRTAAECIDWSLPCPSIFLTREEGRALGVNRPLAEKTMRRIAMGIKRYVIDNPRPFVVGVGGRAGQSHATAADAPLGTVTAKNDRALVTPVLAHLTHNGDRRAHTPAEPVPTVTGARRGEIAMVAPTLIQTGYGEREGQAPRALDIEKPLGTIVGGGVKHAECAVFLAKHFGGVVGHGPDRPLGTVTAIDHHSVAAAHLIKLRGMNGWKQTDAPLDVVCAGAPTFGVVASTLIHMNHGEKQWSGMDEPMRTVTSGNHAAEVRAFLIKYFGQGVGQRCREPLHTVTSKDRFGLVTIAGHEYQIVDIGMRMLTPRELANAQGFDDDYILTGTKTSQVARIGNSVCPVMAEVMVRANCLEQHCEEAAA